MDGDIISGVRGPPVQESLRVNEDCRALVVSKSRVTPVHPPDFPGKIPFSLPRLWLKLCSVSATTSKTMRAVVYRGVNDLRVEEVPVPRIGSSEILVRVGVCGVCPTDIKKVHYGTQAPPRIYGHETAGTIVKVGARVQGWSVGDRVGLHHHVPCLDCHFCRHRAFAQCETYKRTGITAGFEPAGGGYAEYVRVMNFCLPGALKLNL
jgi:L-iditol 2-dehydrogenase